MAKQTVSAKVYTVDVDAEAVAIIPWSDVEMDSEDGRERGG